jgi:hypothetical protein
MFRYCLSRSCKQKVDHPVKGSGTSGETLVDVAAVKGYSTLDQSTPQVPSMETTHGHSFYGLEKLEVGMKPARGHTPVILFLRRGRSREEPIACEAYLTR